MNKNCQSLATTNAFSVAVFYGCQPSLSVDLVTVLRYASHSCSHCLQQALLERLLFLLTHLSLLLWLQGRYNPSPLSVVVWVLSNLTGTYGTATKSGRTCLCSQMTTHLEVTLVGLFDVRYWNRVKVMKRIFVLYHWVKGNTVFFKSLKSRL